MKFTDRSLPYPMIIFKTMLVTGGDTGTWYAQLSSTELLVETASAWVYSGELPSPRWGLRGANIENRILMTGITVGRLFIFLYIYIHIYRYIDDDDDDDDFAKYIIVREIL